MRVLEVSGASALCGPHDSPDFLGSSAVAEKVAVSILYLQVLQGQGPDFYHHRGQHHGRLRLLSFWDHVLVLFPECVPFPSLSVFCGYHNKLGAH